MNTIDKINSMAHVIQLAVAPVFLLTGVASLISVLVGRLVRAIDRFRDLAKTAETDAESFRHRELAALAHRALLIQMAISLCVVCALLICAVIATLFGGQLFDVDVSVAVAVLFVAAMAALILALVMFLRDVFMATAFLPHRLLIKK